MRWCCKLPVPGRPTILITVGQGPIALAAGAGWIVWTFFPRLSFLFSYSLSLGDGPIKIEILSQRAVKPKPTNQPNRSYFHVSKGVRAIEVVL